MDEVTKAEALEDLTEIEGSAEQVPTLFRVRFLASAARIRRYIEQSQPADDKSDSIENRLYELEKHSHAPVDIESEVYQVLEREGLIDSEKED